MEIKKPVLQMKNITKEYFGNKVLKDVSLTLMPGEIHALIGENGAGKSTLMNILFGMTVISETGGYGGEIFINGELAHIKSPNDALKYGIGMVHQEFMLIPGFTVAENIKLNREPLKDNIVSKIFGHNLKTLDIEKMQNDSKNAIKQLGMNIDENEKVSGMPVGYMQFIEIAREIDKTGVQLLVFDEPTAVLAESEAERLLEAMKMLAAKGIGILFISHRLDEIMSVADKVTVLRDGTYVECMSTVDTSATRIAELMVGRKVEKIERESNVNTDKIVMSIKNFKVDMPGERVRGISLDIKQGEILGIGGLAGQGKIGIANGIMGIYPSSGEVKFQDKLVKLCDPRASIAHELGFVSEDRRGVGLLLGMSIEMNMTIPAIQNKNEFLRKFLFFTQYNTKEIRKNAKRFIEELDIRCTGPGQLVRRLSGGNQQKVCIARALTLNPKMIFVSEPTRGIDIGAKKLVLETLIELNKKYGMTIVVTSSELAELRSACDRIVIITEGKIAGILPSDAADAKFGLLMSGMKGEVSENE